MNASLKARYADLNAMADALDDWSEGEDGEPNYEDPHRPDFIAGWNDFRLGRQPNPPSDIAKAAGYNSGFIAARETPLEE